jgi:hypothetical protein
LRLTEAPAQGIIAFVGDCFDSELYRQGEMMKTHTITPQQVIDLVMTLPPDRLPSVYDFALFVKQHPLPLTPEADVFGEGQDQIRADEERWDQQFAASRDELRAIAHEAAAEYRAGRTQPMTTTPEGRLVR